MEKQTAPDAISRRQFVKKAAYVAPVVLSLAVAPAYAKSGSDKSERGGSERGGGRNDVARHRLTLLEFIRRLFW